MKTAEDIKKGLEYLSTTDLAEKVEKARHGLPYAYVEDCAAEALAYIRQLEARIPKWISMEERTPEISDLVLVIANGKPRENIELHNAILIASYWADEGWIADGFDGWDGLVVSHWMPLPESPKEG